jgi:flagellar basal body-associated protein FliL
MSETPDTKPKDGAAAAAAAAPAAKKGGGAVAMILGLLLPPILAAAGSFGGARVAGGHQPAAPHVEAPAHVEAKPPGPTVALDPFLVSVPDAKGKGHPMKLSVAVEFGGIVHDEAALKAFVPRIRDAILAHMRTLSYEEALESAHSETLREDLLERCKKAGAVGAERILITDLVSQ